MGRGALADATSLPVALHITDLCLDFLTLVFKSLHQNRHKAKTFNPVPARVPTLRPALPVKSTYPLSCGCCDHNQMAQSEGSLLSCSSGGQQSEIQMSAGLAPSGGTEGESVPGCCLSLVFLGVQMRPFLFCTHLHMGLYIVYVSGPNLFLLRTLAIGPPPPSSMISSRLDFISKDPVSK